MKGTGPALLLLGGLMAMSLHGLAQTGGERLGEAAMLGLDGKETIDRAATGAPAGADAGPPRGDGGVLDIDDAGVVAVDPAAEQRAAQARALLDRLAAEAVEQRRSEEVAQAAAKAQQDALRRAAEARTALQEKILENIAAAEGARVKIAETENALRAETNALRVEAEQALSAADQAFDAAGTVSSGDNADALFEGTLVLQDKALAAVDAAMEARGRRIGLELRNILEDVPADIEIRLSRQLAESDKAEIDARLQELGLSVDTANADLDRVEKASTELWYGIAERRLDVARRYNDVRLALMDKLGPTKKASLTSLTELGRDNLAVALRHLTTTMSFHVQHRAHDVVHFPTRLSDPLFAGALVWVMIKMLFAAALAFFFIRRWPALYPRFRNWALGLSRNRARVKLLENSLAIAEDAGPQAGALALALWTRRTFADLGPEPELTVVLGLLVWILTYQLTAKLLHRLVLRLARKRHSLTVPFKLRILRTVRAALRFGFIAGWLAAVTEAMVGSGILYAAVRSLVFVAGAVLFFVLVRRWREDIANVYVSNWPDTRFAQTIDKSRARWYGVLLASLALLWVAARAAIAVARDFVLGFEQTRKALAYVFQVRIERQAKEKGRRSVDESVLPDTVRTAFSPAPCDEEKHLVDRFADLPDWAKRIQAGNDTILVSAPAWSGLTTWLDRLAQQLDRPVVRLRPVGRWSTEEDLVCAVAASIGTEASSLAELSLAIMRLPQPPVFIVDEVDRTFVRALGGYRALDALGDLIGETDGSASWVVGGRRLALRFLEKTRGFEAAFDHCIQLDPWGEVEIRDLIHRRQATTGTTLSFEDLLVRDLDDAVRDAHVVETETGYLRLLWTFSEGAPGVALHLWLRSLVATGQTLKVQLHDAPSADDLEAISLADRFFLQAMVLHRAMSAQDLARSVNAPEKRARVHLHRGQDLGLYTVGPDGMSAVSTHYWPATIRYLRRKNLL